MGTTTDPQMALEEREVADAELERALEDREQAKGIMGEARRKYSAMDEVVKGKLGDLSLKDGEVVRVGRFRITQTAVPARSVAFDTQPTTRLSISVPADED